MFTADDLKRLDDIAREASRIEFTEGDKKEFDNLEKELSAIDLDFLLR